MVIATVVGLGVVFFRLHSLPERLGHKKLQFEIVAVLGLLSLFTHVHIFWVAGLLLALIDLPDFQTPLEADRNVAGKTVWHREPGGQEPVLKRRPGPDQAGHSQTEPEA